MRPERRGRAERLVDDAIALRQLEQLRDLLGGRSGIQLEPEPDLPEADRRFLGDAERSAEVEIALGGDGSPWIGIDRLVATARRVTPAQATNASRSMSPEQARLPSPPVAGWSPAVTSALPVSTLHATASAPRLPRARSVISAAPGCSR